MPEIDGYVQAWLGREPAMEVARGFVPAAARDTFALWGALLHQLDEAAFELSDAHVARTKLAWWADELAGIATGAVRHPLARALAEDGAARRVGPADWRALALSAIDVGERDGAPVDVDALLRQGERYAAALATVEAVFWNAPGDTGCGPARGAIAVHHALRRLEHGLGRDAARFPWPMNLRARHQASPEDFAAFPANDKARAVLADLADALAARLAPGAPGVILYRRAQATLDARRLGALAAGRFEPRRATGLGVLWSLWRAARR